MHSIYFLSLPNISAETNPASAWWAGPASVLKVAVGAHYYSWLRAGPVELPFEVGYALLP